ncbi:hypothetical protein ACFSTC_43665 [Nonomuraea ferruginea]
MGIIGGVACSVLGHLLLDGVDLVWRSGLLAWAAVLGLCAAFLVLTRTAGADPARTDADTPARTEGADPAGDTSARAGGDGGLAPAGTWFLVGPVLLLAGMAATGYAKAAVGPSVIGWDALLQVAALVAATVLASRVSHSPAFDAAAAVLLVCFTVLLLLPSSGSTGLGLSGAMVLLWTGPVLAASAQRPAGGRQGGRGARRRAGVPGGDLRLLRLVRPGPGHTQPGLAGHGRGGGGGRGRAAGAAPAAGSSGAAAGVAEPWRWRRRSWCSWRPPAGGRRPRTVPWAETRSSWSPTTSGWGSAWTDGCLWTTSPPGPPPRSRTWCCSARWTGAGC